MWCWHLAVDSSKFVKCFPEFETGHLWEEEGGNC